MKHIFTLFLAFLLPTLPAFGVSNFDGFTGFKQSYQSCALDVKKSGFDLEISDLPEKYQTMYKNHAKETVTTAIDGKCNGVSYTCKPGDLVTCNPCHMFSYFTKTIKPQYIAELTEEKCGHLKQTSSETSTKSSAAPTKQTASKPTTTAAPADEDFDFVAAQKSDRAAYETDYDAPTPTPAQKPQKKETKPAPRDTYDELQTVGEIHAADAAADAERAKPKQTKKEPDFDFAAQSANDMNASAARSGLLATPAPEPATPEKSERQQQIEENTKKSLTVQPKPEKKKIAQTANEKSRLTRTAIDKFCKDDGYVYKKNAIETPSIGYVQDLCNAESKVKCADDEVVNNAGKCQKNVKVDINKPGDMTGHEWTEADGERMKCDQDKDKKHTKFENNKCVCESNDYEMQSDGYCTLKRAKCLKQKNTKYENGRCVCTSDDFEMHKDNNCYYTAEALDREASEMEDAENAANDAKSSAEVIQLLCTDSGGTWKNDKCTCPKGYELNDTNECEITNEAQKLAEKEKACTETDGNWNKTSKICKCKTGFTTSREGKCVSTYDEEKANSCAETGGKWTKKNTCNCKTGWKLDENGICQPNEKTVNKQRHKELCKSPNTWNDTLNKCTCKDKKQFFDDELGCTAASQAFTNAETELNTLKGQLDTKLTELASANESEEQ